MPLQILQPLFPNKVIQLIICLNIRIFLSYVWCDLYHLLTWYPKVCRVSCNNNILNMIYLPLREQRPTSQREFIALCDSFSANIFQRIGHYHYRKTILAYLQTSFIIHSIYRWITKYIHKLLQPWIVLLPSPLSPLSLCYWLLILLGNCICVLLWWVIISWFYWYQFPKTNNQLLLDCRPNFLSPLSTSGLLLLWLEKNLLPSPPIIQIILNMDYSKRESKRRTRRLRRKTNR